MTSPRALTATSAATTTPPGQAERRAAEPALHGARHAVQFPHRRTGARADVALRHRRRATPTPRRRDRRRRRGGRGRRPRRGRTGSPPARWARGSVRRESRCLPIRATLITPVAASRPKALPPASTMAWTCWTVLSGSSRSVSRVPGRRAAHVDAGDRAVAGHDDRAAGGALAAHRVTDEQAVDVGERAVHRWRCAWCLRAERGSSPPRAARPPRVMCAR